MSRRYLYSIAAFAALSVAACSGGGGGVSGAGPFVPAATPAAKTSAGALAAVTIRILIPARAKSTAVRRPHYVSPSTMSAVVTAGSTVTKVDFSQTSPNCSTVATGLQCDVDVTAPPSSAENFAVATYDGSQGSGNELSSGTATGVAITMGIANTVTITLTGIVASASVTIPAIPVCVATTVPYTVNALDADQNVISGPYDEPITIAYSDPTTNSTLTGTTAAKPGDGGTITYNGDYEPGGTITLSAAGVPDSIATFFPTPAVCKEYGLNNKTPVGLEYIKQGSDGNMYFTEQFAHDVGHIFTTGATAGQNIAVPITSPQTAGSTDLAVPTDLALGSDKNLWIGDEANGMDEFSTTTNTGNTYGLNAYAVDADALGPDGNIWFTDVDHALVDYVTPGGAFGTPVSMPNVQVSRSGIAAGTDGAMWVAEAGAFKIARVPLSGSPVTEYDIPNPNGDTYSPNRIASDGKGNLWFTETDDSNIGKITQNGGVITLYPLPVSSSFTYDIALGPDGNMWFTEATLTGDRIGRITPDGTITDYPIITTGNNGTFGIAAGPAPGNNMYFTETSNDTEKIGYLTI